MEKNVFGRCKLPMNLQLFAADSGGGAGASGTAAGASGNPSASLSSGDGSSEKSTPQIDYARIQQMLDGTLAAKEDTALKAYFKQQGLSQTEAEQAMATFKEQKAKNQPDVGAIQTQLLQAQQIARKAQVNERATLAGMELGLDSKTLPYVIKLADFGSVVGEDGTINDEAIKNALSKVLEDVPALKPQIGQSQGFRFGADSQNQNKQTTDDALKKAFGL